MSLDMDPRLGKTYSRPYAVQWFLPLAPRDSWYKLSEAVWREQQDTIRGWENGSLSSKPRSGTRTLSETRRRLLAEGHIVRDIMCCPNLCWKYWGFAYKLKIRSRILRAILRPLTLEGFTRRCLWDSRRPHVHNATGRWRFAARSRILAAAEIGVSNKTTKARNATGAEVEGADERGPVRPHRGPVPRAGPPDLWGRGDFYISLFLLLLLYYIILYHIILCYDMLCYVMLYYIILYCIIYHII